MSCTEKYRPTEWEEVIGQENVVKSIREMLKKTGKMPNLLFTGPPGTGKTTIAHMIGKELWGDRYLLYFNEYNASDTRKIDDIRTIIKPKSRSAVPIIIFFDEADGLTPDAQQVLRRIIENSVNAIFILSANKEKKILDAIRSRCVPFRFRQLGESQIVEILLNVIKKENIQIEQTSETRDAIVEIVRQVHGDARLAINTLEKIVTAKGELSVKSVLEMKKVKTGMQALNAALAGDMEKAKNLIQDTLINNDDDVDKVLDELYEGIETLEDGEIKWRLLYEMGPLEDRVRNTYHPIYQLVSFMSYVRICAHLRK